MFGFSWNQSEVHLDFLLLGIAKKQSVRYWERLPSAGLRQGVLIRIGKVRLG